MFYKKNRSLKNKLFVNTIVFMVALFSITSLICSVFLYRLAENAMNEQVVSISNNLTQALEVQDWAHLMIERKMQQHLEKAMPVFQEQYQLSNGAPEKIDLTRLKQAAGPEYDFFILNKQNTVIASTFLPDIGLQLGAYSQVKQFLDYIWQSDDIQSERAMTAVYTGINKYIYQATPDKQYILEIGMSFATGKALLAEPEMNYFDFPVYINNIIQRNPAIQTISVYDWMGTAYHSSGPATDQALSGNRKATFDSVIATGVPASLHQDNTLYYYTLFHPYDSNPNGYAEKVVEVAINTLPMHNAILKAIIVQGSIILLSLLLALLLGSRFIHHIIAPVSEITLAVKQIAAGDIHSPVQSGDDIAELQSLSTSVESMRLKLQSQFNQLNLYNQELTQSYQTTIQAFFRALEHREQYTAQHSLGVNKLALAIGKEMNLSPDDLLQLNWGSLLHDIGKLAISDAILLKPSALTPEEYTEMKRHPLAGAEVLPTSPFFHHAAEVVLYHHERYDGQGYPEGLRGVQIPLLARICAVADAVDAMISDRPYRKGCSWTKAVAEIEKHSGSQFDPAVVKAFLQISTSLSLEQATPDKKIH